MFNDLKTLLVKTNPARSGDYLTDLAVVSEGGHMTAQTALADTPLSVFPNEILVPYEDDEVTRLILDRHDVQAFDPIASLTVGELRDWLLLHETDSQTLANVAPDITPGMTAAVSKPVRDQDPVAMVRKCCAITRFRNITGLPDWLSVRLQSNYPTNDPKDIAVSIIDGLLYSCGDAAIGISPAGNSPGVIVSLLQLMDELRNRYTVPTRSYVLTHATNAIRATGQNAPVDLVFQLVTDSKQANAGFGIGLVLSDETHDVTRSLPRDSVDSNVMYSETSQGSALSTDTYHGVDQQTVKARAYAVARAFSPLLINTIIDFIGPEYLYDGKRITRAGLENHFYGKLIGLPMGYDIYCTSHAEADQNDVDTLLTLFDVAGICFIMGVPNADDVMLNYRSTSFYDTFYLCDLLRLRPASEFEAWLQNMDVVDAADHLQDATTR